MSERREWGAQVDKTGRLRCYPDGCGIKMDWETVHVREVLPGDVIRDAKIKALESTIELLRKGMSESCRDRYEVMGGCVYAAKLTAAARKLKSSMEEGHWRNQGYLDPEVRIAMVAVVDALEAEGEVGDE